MTFADLKPGDQFIFRWEEDGWTEPKLKIDANKGRMFPADQDNCVVIATGEGCYCEDWRVVSKCQ